MKYSILGSFRNQLLILILAAVLPALIIIIYSDFERLRHDRADAENSAGIILLGLASDHENSIAATEKFLETLARLPQIKSRDASACNQLFKELLKDNKIYCNLYATNVHGTIFASGKAFQQREIKETKYLLAALQTKKFTVGSYLIGTISGRPVLPLAYPVTDSSGRMTGIVGAVLDLDKYGQYFVHLTKLSKGTTLNLLDRNFRRLYRYPDMEKFVGVLDLPDMIKNMSGKPDEGIFTALGVDGIKRLFAYKRFYLKEDSLPYLYMRVGIPEEEALAFTRNFFLRNIGLLVLSFFLAVLVVWLLGNLIVKRLNLLVHAAEKLGHGDLTARTGINHKGDEIGRLAHSFDEMAELLEVKEADRRRAEEEREQVISELQKKILEVKQLSGLLPICASCKKIRDDKGYWEQIEVYIKNHSEAEFSHGLCPDCIKKLYPEFANKTKKSA